MLSLCWPRGKRLTLLVHVEWPSHPPSALAAKATACHSPSGLISPWWMTISRSRSRKKCVKFFKDSASARNHHSRSTIKMVPNDISSLTPRCNSSKSSSTMVLSNPPGGWKAVAFAMRTLGRLGHSTSTLQPTTIAFNDSNYPRIFRAPILVNHLLLLTAL